MVFHTHWIRIMLSLSVHDVQISRQCIQNRLLFTLHREKSRLNNAKQKKFWDAKTLAIKGPTLPVKKCNFFLILNFLQPRMSVHKKFQPNRSSRLAGYTQQKIKRQPLKILFQMEYVCKACINHMVRRAGIGSIPSLSYSILLGFYPLQS